RRPARRFTLTRRKAEPSSRAAPPRPPQRPRAQRWRARRRSGTADDMYPSPTWGGVDWFGCDDDLTWERTDAPLEPVRPARIIPTATRTATRTAGRTARRRGRRPDDVPPPARRVLILDVENVCPSS